MNDPKLQLIKLGFANPDLRPHIRPVLHRLVVANIGLWKKLSRGTGGTINGPDLLQILRELGWTIEVGSAAKKINGSTFKATLRMMGLYPKGSNKPEGFSVDGVAGVNDDQNFRSWGDLDKLKAVTKKVMDHPNIHIRKKGKEVGHLYCEELWVNADSDPEGRHEITFGKVSLGVPTWTITAPNGKRKKIALSLKPNETIRDFKSNAVWKFLYDNGLMQQAQEHVEVGAVSGYAGERTRENTGTCAVCFRNVKLRGGKIVDHGFEVRQYQGRKGSCFGVGHLPFEVSPEGSEAWLQELKKYLKSSKVYLSALESGNYSQPLPYMRRVVKPDSDKYRWAVSNEIDRVKADIRSLGRDIQELEREISGWQERPLP